MRHQHKGFKLGRTSAHRKATMSAMSTALIKHKRITTTHAKAKALRLYVEPLISRAKEDTTHNRRQVFRRLQDKHAVTELFGDIAERVGSRPGGYTRIVKIGQRAGDSAPMAIIELVDYNDVKPDGSSSRRRKTRRSRSRRSGGSAAAAATTAADAAAEVADVSEEAVEEAVEEVAADAPEAVTDEAAEASEAESEAVANTVDDAVEAAEDVEEAIEASADAEDADAGEDADEEKKDA